jgi:hypothetical protein
MMQNLRRSYWPFGDRSEGLVPPDGAVTDEARRVLNYLLHVNLSEFDATVAPLTVAKEEAAESGDLLQHHINEACRERSGPFRFDLFTAEEVRQHCGEGSDKTVAAALQPLSRFPASGLSLSFHSR